MKKFRIEYFLMWIGFAGVIAIIGFPIGTVIGLIIIFWQISRAVQAIQHAKLPGANGVSIADYQKMTEEEKQALADRSNKDFFAKQKARTEKLKAEGEAARARANELIAQRKAKKLQK